MGTRAGQKVKRCQANLCLTQKPKKLSKVDLKVRNVSFGGIFLISVEKWLGIFRSDDEKLIIIS